MIVYCVVWLVVVGTISAPRFWTTWDTKTNTVPVTATVVEQVGIGPDADLYVEYVSADNERTKARLTEHSRPKVHHVGDLIDIRYRPDDPRRVYHAKAVAELSYLDTDHSIMLALFAGLFVVGWWMIWRGQSRSSWRMSRRPASTMDPDSDG